MTYSEKDVQRLVDACEDLDRITHNRSIWIAADRLDVMKQALRPFQPDPDAALVRKVDRMMTDISPRTAPALIAAVREHDRGTG